MRTYEPLTDTKVLEQLATAGIYVLNSVYPYGGDAASAVTGRVNAVKSHPAILMWVIGNEWNYNGLYVNMSQADSQARLNDVATLIRAADPIAPDRQCLRRSTAQSARRCHRSLLGCLSCFQECPRNRGVPVCSRKTRQCVRLAMLKSANVAASTSSKFDLSAAGAASNVSLTGAT